MSEIFLVVEQVAEREHSSVRTIQERIAKGLLPHRKLPGMRRVLIPVDELERYEAGECELETIALPGGGRICRLKSSANGDVLQARGGS